MSTTAPEVHELAPTLTIWHRYNPKVKAELFSTALRSEAIVYLIDPSYLDPESLGFLLGNWTVAGVIATNGNHERDSALYARQFSAPFYATSEAGIPGALPICDGQILAGGLRVITIEGAAPGECALHCGHSGGTLIMGDALINMEPYGFTFLPAKYCSNQKQMRKSLRKLLGQPFERMLFAHGTPLISGARDRLRTLLDGEA